MQRFSMFLRKYLDAATINLTFRVFICYQDYKWNKEEKSYCWNHFKWRILS